MNEFLGSFLGSKEKAKESIFTSYKWHINGFAAFLNEEEVTEIAKHPNVVSVFLNKEVQLHTTRTWGFLMQENNRGVVIPGSLWTKANFGKDVIIANIDSGVWPTSMSFDDKGFGPIPSRWKGSCGKYSDGFTCNRKLIGANYYNKGFEALFGKINSTLSETPRDHAGHGTHTLSTAAGNFVPRANFSGQAGGTAKGGSPLARAAAYKACWPSPDGQQLVRCADADVLAALDDAIHDGADVLSLSLGARAGTSFEDAIAIGTFHAVRRGIAVVCSAGNDGPAPGTVTNIPPWVITVAASTLDRDYPAYVQFKNGLLFRGVSLSPALSERKFYPLIDGAQAKLSNSSDFDAMLCKPGTLDPRKVKGRIVACLRGQTARVDKGRQASLAGAAGMILCNDESTGNDIVADPHLLPASHLNYKDGHSVFAYINSTRNPQVALLPPATSIGAKPSPVMAPFSSTGPNPITPEILKPDITAPGVQVLAANSEAKTNNSDELVSSNSPYVIMSGTSMACPHVAGVVGLLRSVHALWSPAAIRSAIVTTARSRDSTGNPIKDATPFNYGHGHLRPNRAADPGLVYDLTTDEYLAFLCAIGYNETTIQNFSEKPYTCPSKNITLTDFNYPSITVPSLSGSLTVTRRVKNVGPPGTYTARLRPPLGVSVSVEPRVLKFELVGEERSFRVTLKDKGYGSKGYVFGRLIWSHHGNKHHVRSPIVVKTSSG